MLPLPYELCLEILEIYKNGLKKRMSLKKSIIININNQICLLTEHQEYLEYMKMNKNTHPGAPP